MKTLSAFQENVLDRMEKADLGMVMAATRRHWQNGERYYIDARCRASKQLRADFEKGNQEATA